MQAIKSLVLYKRHHAECAVNKSRAPVAKTEVWMDCNCPIWIVGKTPKGDVVPRQSTGYNDLKSASKLKASLIGRKWAAASSSVYRLGAQSIGSSARTTSR